MADLIVEAVKADLDARSARGIEKYGVTLCQHDLPLAEWLEHAYHEALDHALYLKRAMREIDNG